MSKHSRRSFLKASGGVLTVGAIGGLTMSCRKAPKLVEGKWPGFDYAMCNESMKDLPFAEQCKIVVGAGYTGIEIAPFTLVKDGVAEITATQRQEMGRRVCILRRRTTPFAPNRWTTSTNLSISAAISAERR